MNWRARLAWWTWMKFCPKSFTMGAAYNVRYLAGSPLPERRAAKRFVMQQAIVRRLCRAIDPEFG